MMDSDRPVEQMLRAAAEKRRAEAGPPFAMHPATRKLLQGEVSRTFKTSRPEVARSGLSLLQLWPRFAMVAVSLTILAFLCWMIWPGTDGADSFSLAKETVETAPAETDRFEPPKSPVLDLAKEDETARKLVPSRGRSDGLEGAVLALRPEPAAAAPPTALAAEQPPVELRLNMEETKSKGLPIQNFSFGLSPSETPAIAPPEPSLGDRVERPERTVTGLPPAAAPPPAAASSEAREIQFDSTRGYAFGEQVPDTLDTNMRGGVANSLAGEFGAFESPSPKDTTRSRTLASNEVRDKRFRTVVRAGSDASQRQVFYNLALKQSAGGQVFARRGAGVTSEKLSEAELQPLLTSFSVEQAGRELRVVDNDGSVYAGPVQITNEQALGRVQWVANSAASPQSVNEDALTNDKQASQAPQFYWFHVTGTNRTLNQKVEFIGNLVQNAAPTGISNQLGYAAAGGVLQSQVSPVYQNQAGQAVISGKAVVGGKQEVNIDAQSPAP